MPSDEINIALDKGDVKQLIQNIVTGPNKGLVTRALLETFADCDDDSVALIVKSILGILPKTMFSKGDDVVLDKDSGSTWRYDEPKMKELGLLKDQWLTKVRVINVHPYSPTPYFVRYSYWDKSSGKEKSDVEQVKIGRIAAAEEFPEGLSDKEDDLPF